MPTQHSGSVYEHRSKNNWKETWLCLEPDGALTWKRKDAYQVKGQIYVDREILNQVEIDGWPKKKCRQNDANPFSMRIPMEIRGSKTKKKLYLKDGDSLDLWLDALATVMGKWKLWKNVKQRETDKYAREHQDEKNTNLEPMFKYEIMVQFYKTTWQEFLRLYNEKNDDVEENGNGRIQNGNVVTTHQQQKLEKFDAPTTSTANGSQANRPTSHNSASVNQVQQVSINGATSQGIQNGTKGHIIPEEKSDDDELYGEEDSEDEEHF